MQMPKLPREDRSRITLQAMKEMLVFDKPVHKSVVVALIQSKNQFSKELMEPDGENRTLPAWQHAFEFALTYCVKLGWFKKAGRGDWSLTVEGRKVAEKMPLKEFHERLSAAERIDDKAAKAVKNEDIEIVKVKTADEAIRFVRMNSKKPLVIMLNC